MAVQAVDLGPFAPDRGDRSVWAAAGAMLGVSAAGLAALAIVTDLAGKAALNARPYALPIGGAAVIASVIGLYQVSVGRTGRSLAVLGALLGAGGSLAAFVHGGILTGTLEFREFGVAYFDREILADIWKDILKAGVNTVKYAAIAEVGAVAVGLIIATFGISRRRLLRVPAIAYVDLVRGLPLLMMILLVAFGPTYIGIVLPTVTAFLVALIINNSAYVAEIFRAGIQSVERGQMDAARSLGMPYSTSMVHVILPQAVRKVIPPLTNEFIALVKDTSVLFAIGATIGTRELLITAKQLSSVTFSATPLMAASIAYLVITLPLTRLVTILERRLRSGLLGAGGAPASATDASMEARPPVTGAP